MNDHILIRYGELSLKKTNRKQFVNRITNNIKRALKEYTALEYESRGMRFYIHLNNTPSKPIIEKLKKVAGIYSFSVVDKTNSNIKYMTPKEVIDDAKLGNELANKVVDIAS